MTAAILQLISADELAAQMDSPALKKASKILAGCAQEGPLALHGLPPAVGWVWLPTLLVPFTSEPKFRGKRSRPSTWLEPACLARERSNF